MTRTRRSRSGVAGRLNGAVDVWCLTGAPSRALSESLAAASPGAWLTQLLREQVEDTVLEQYGVCELQRHYRSSRSVFARRACQEVVVSIATFGETAVAAVGRGVRLGVALHPIANPVGTAVEERIADRLLKLLRAMLRAGVMQDGAVTRGAAGTPQGGVLSPCLANVYLHRLDRQWTDRGCGVLVRYADDLLVLCHSRRPQKRCAL